MSTGSSASPLPPKRAWALVDGFNYYYAIKDAIWQGAAPKTIKWLDYRRLAATIVAREHPTAILEQVRWYTAYVKNDPRAVDRHRWYRRALEAQGVIAVDGEYKQIKKKCGGACGQMFTTWEEKATDVNIAIDIVSGAAVGDYDVLFLFSGDSDLAPAVKRVRALWSKEIVVVVPGWRKGQHGPVKNHELKANADKLVRLLATDLFAAQLPETVPLSDGRTAHRPPQWR